MIADVEDGRVVALRGDPQHPVTQGFLCYRTSRFLKRQYHPARLKKPLLRRGDRQVEIPLDEALDLTASKLMAIKRESGPAAILHYRSGGSLGMMKVLADYFFEKFGPTSTKTGDICSGGGDAAQSMDFGCEDSSDVFDLLHARHILNWGKNLHVSNIHLIPIIEEARRRGARVYTIDPVYTRSARVSDEFFQPRPDGDISLALAVAQLLFSSGRVAESARSLCDHFDEFRALAFSKPLPVLLAECDLPLERVEQIAGALAEGPTAILVGWGMGRRLLGATSVRLLDALCAISGNLGRRGGGVSFYFKRRGAFDVSFKGRNPPPRVFNEPVLGREILAAQDPPVRAIWVTAGNPVAMLPDSATVARAFESTEFTVVVDNFQTDTTRRASLVLPTTTLLEDDDLMGAFGHHWIGVSRPVVPPPDGVLTDFELLQGLGRRMGMEEVLAGTVRDWKVRMLSRAAERGVTLERLEQGAAKNPFVPEVIFADGKVPTASGRVNLISEIPPVSEDAGAGFPLYLYSNSTEKAQSSQWANEAEGLSGPMVATVHPDAANGVRDGELACLASAMGAVTVRVAHDARQRRDLIVVPKGGHYDRGTAANALVAARPTDHGGGAAYLSTRVRLEPLR